MKHNQKELKKIIDKAFNTLDDSSKDALLQYSFNIENNFNYYLSYIINHRHMFYFDFPDSHTFLGSGKTISHRVKTKNDYLAVKSYLNKNYFICSNIKNNNPYYFGSLPFKIKNKTSYPWDGLSCGEFIIPSILFDINKNNCLITFSQIITSNSKKNIILNKIENEIKVISNTKAIQNKNYQLLNKKTIPDKKEYIESIDKIIDEINSTKLEKIVLSRLEKYSINKGINLLEIIVNMQRLYSNCFNFILQVGENEYFIGSSPEKLLKLNNNKIKADALAGTAKNKANLNHHKEIEEHKYVVKHINKKLKEYSNNIKISKTKLLKLKYAYHLNTQIEAILDKKVHILDILKEIYPTPALSGYPIELAKRNIKNYELFDRGLYAGAIGRFNVEGNGNFFVPIRCGLIKNKEIYLFAGGGITNNSKSLKEWNETEMKFNHIRSILGLEQY